MNIQPIKTEKILSGDDLFAILDKFIIKLEENSIVVVTSKIISLCESNTLPLTSIDKKTLVRKEADFFLEPKKSNYPTILTIKDNILIAAAGIDESNGNGNYILWPKDPYESANIIRDHLKKRFNLKNLGIIITDSKTTPLRWGTTGVALSYSGFKPLHNYIGKKDIFKREMMMTKSNIMDGLAAAAVVTMGECNEQTPLAIISDLPFVTFCGKNPTQEEIDELKIDIKDDLYTDLLTSVEWKK